MLNGIFVFCVLASILLAAYSGQMQALTDAILQDSRKAVSLSISGPAASSEECRTTVPAAWGWA